MPVSTEFGQLEWQSLAETINVDIDKASEGPGTVARGLRSGGEGVVINEASKRSVHRDFYLQLRLDPPRRCAQRFVCRARGISIVQAVQPPVLASCFSIMF
jgi:hypothetical protein